MGIPNRTKILCKEANNINKGENTMKMIDYYAIDKLKSEEYKREIEEIFKKDKSGYIVAESSPSFNSYKRIAPYLKSNNVENVFLSPTEIKLTFKNGNIITFDRKNIEYSIALEPEIFCNLLGGNNMTMPNIVNYTYNPEIALTTIEWADGTKTTVRAENPNMADQYTGFVTAVAKKACGNNNTINNLYDEWAIKKPAREFKKQIINNNKLLEEKRIAEKRKTKREQYLIRKEALRLKREYEAKKYANEKHGVPMDEDK